MKKEVNEVYRYYKQQYGSGIILFHVGSYYEAYNDDAQCLHNIVSKMLNYPFILDTDWICRIPADNDERLLNLIQECGKQKVAVHIVSYVGDDGKCCLPKVNQILQDIEDDY